MKEAQERKYVKRTQRDVIKYFKYPGLKSGATNISPHGVFIVNQY